MKNSVNIFARFNLRKGNNQKLKKYLTRLANPEKKLLVIHVVGTNGKGSISYYLSKILVQNGYRTGLFISPSYWEHNERIKVNNVDISDQQLNQFLNQIYDVVQKEPINFFEIFFMVSLLHFNQQQCQICILEAGIGGLLDSTALADNSLFTVLTSVSYDHTNLLGNQISEIIDQKIRIAQPQALVFVADSNRQYQKILAQYPQKLIWADHQMISNNHFINEAANLALKICQFFQLKPLADWNQDLLPGRMMLIDDYFLFDGAHNPDAITKLLSNIKVIYPNKKINIFYSSLSTKEYDQCIRLIGDFNHGKNFWITTFNHPKALEKKMLIDHSHWLEYDQLIVKLKAVLEQNKQNTNNLYLFCGSFYFIAQIHELLNQLKNLD